MEVESKSRKTGRCRTPVPVPVPCRWPGRPLSLPQPPCRPSASFEPRAALAWSSPEGRRWSPHPVSRSKAVAVKLAMDTCCGMVVRCMFEWFWSYLYKIVPL